MMLKYSEVYRWKLPFELFSRWKSFILCDTVTGIGLELRILIEIDKMAFDDHSTNITVENARAVCTVHVPTYIQFPRTRNNRLKTILLNSL